jgi:eukaryotic-like serine/threonine-protein kinase
MTLVAGTRVGSYEVVSPLGAGGMGEVYRARDTKLQRDVAVKVLPEHLANDRDRLARFEREAQVLAALNHPHIAQIYGFEESGTTRALVLELVEGDTLAERISHGPLALDEALPIARQIAEALEAAHDQGIIHRDLKPANIKITPAGDVKVLDFGLAKLADNAAGPSGHSSHTISPTLTSPVMTGVGTILGTAAYMAPEQAKGRPADKRSDMWAFGCVLYEMLTGARTFEGEDVSDTMAAVLRAEPDWKKLPAGLSPALRALIRRCLEKDRHQRVVDAGAALFVLSDLSAPSAVAPSGAPSVPLSRGRMLTVAAIVLVAAALAAAGTWFAMRPDPPRVVRFDVTPPPDAALTVGPAGVNLVISPEGKRVVYHARHQSANALDIRSLDTGESVALPQTDGATHASFSPDGSHLAFFKAGKLYKLAIDARVLTALADVSDGSGISWGHADTIVYTRPGPKGGLFRIAASGGVPALVTAPDTKTGEQDYMSPELLPDGATAVFVVRKATSDNSRLVIAARTLASGEQKVVVDNGVSPRYVRHGYLLYVQGSVLTGVRFDPGRLAASGPEVPLLNGIITKASIANFGVSRDGTLTYIPGSTVNYVSRLIWRARDGKLLAAASPAQLEYPRYPRVSPDGRRFAATVGPAQEGHIWIYDMAGAAQPYKITFNAHNTFPTWSPDGSRVAFSTTRDGPTRNLFTIAADGSVVEPTRVVANDRDKTNFTWSRDGVLMYQALGDATRMDLWTQPAAPGGKSTVWLHTPFAENNPVFSPDGKWVAFVADTTGPDEVWVRPFPGPGSPVRVSSAGGHDPVWARDGKELFYQEGTKLMAAALLSMAPMRFETPRVLFEGGFIPWEPNTPRTYDVAADGRFLMIEPTTTFSQRFNVVLNWVEELKRRVP